MDYVCAKNRTVALGNLGTSAPAIYVIDSPEHPFDAASIMPNCSCSIVSVPVRSWNDSLTPWPAPGLYREEQPFGGKASIALDELLESIPLIEHEAGLTPARRAICGYSLGGLFALYALVHSETFCACACLSGSVWYEGWVDHLRSLELDGTGRLAFFSVGSKEKHAAPRLLHGVQRNMEECAAILGDRGYEVQTKVGPGNHMSFVAERFATGLDALESFLTDGNR